MAKSGYSHNLHENSGKNFFALGEPVEYYLILVCCDFLAATLSFSMAVLTRKLLGKLFPTLPPFLPHHILHLINSYWWLFFSIFLIFLYQQLYSRRLCFWEEVREIFNALVLSFLVIFAIIFARKIGPLVSRLTLGLMFGYSLFFFPLIRYLIKSTLFKSHRYRRKALIVGASNGAEELIRALESDRFLGYEIVGLVDDDPSLAGKHVHGKEILGPVNRISELISRWRVSTVFLNTTSFENGEHIDILPSIQNLAKEVCILPDLRDFGMLNAETQTYFKAQIFLLRVRNNLKSPANQLLKVLMDYTLSILMLPILLPIMGIIAILIKLDSRGPVFYVHERVGRGEKRIKVYKFRSMYVNSDEILADYLARNPEARREWELYRKLKGADPRVTKVGRFLRKTSLDELPQIFNVLKGDMSLVGPRPVMQEEIDKYYREYAQYYYMVKPGITGLWQISGRSNVDYDRRVRLDAWYVLNWSLWLDFVILINTVSVVLKGEGAH